MRASRSDNLGHGKRTWTGANADVLAVGCVDIQRCAESVFAGPTRGDLKMRIVSPQKPCQQFITLFTYRRSGAMPAMPASTEAPAMPDIRSRRRLVMAGTLSRREAVSARDAMEKQVLFQIQWCPWRSQNIWSHRSRVRAVCPKEVHSGRARM